MKTSSTNHLPDRTVLRSMFYQMCAMRSFEEALYRAFMTEKMPGTMHQSNGQEAISAGVSHALQPGDMMTSTHRGHGHAIAMGIPLKELMAEMYARKTGVCRGMGGSMHIFDLRRGFLGTVGVVGAGVPIAAGAALALQLEGKGGVAVAFLGDGAANQGAVHEAMNLSAVWKLPVIFVCENNRYAVSLPFEKAFAVERVAMRAEGYGLPGMTLDGNDVLAVYAAAREAIARARAGEGPSFIECLTYRHRGHSRFEPGTYRPQEELQEWLAKDPIQRFRRLLVEQGLFSEPELDAVSVEASQAIEEAIAYAKSSPPAELQMALSLEFKT